TDTPIAESEHAQHRRKPRPRSAAVGTNPTAATAARKGRLNGSESVHDKLERSPAPQTGSGAPRFGGEPHEPRTPTASQHQARAANQPTRTTRRRFRRGDRAATWLVAAYCASSDHRTAQSRSRGDAEQGCQ